MFRTRSDSPDVMDGHKSRVFSACFNPKSVHEIISAGWDDTVQFWDTRQAHSLRFISGVHMCGDGLDISRNGREVYIQRFVDFTPITCFMFLFQDSVYFVRKLTNLCQIIA